MFVENMFMNIVGKYPEAMHIQDNQLGEDDERSWMRYECFWN